MKRNIIIGLIAVLVFSLFSCDRRSIDFDDNAEKKVSVSLRGVVENRTTKTDNGGMLERINLDGNLCVTVSSSYNPVNVEQLTKGYNTTTDSFYDLYGTAGFKMYAEKQGVPTTVLFNNSVFKLENNIWKPEDDTLWPDYAASFYAWAPGDAVALSPENKTFTYTVETNNEEQTDFLVAYADVDRNYWGTLPLFFNHALCEVKFCSNELMPAGSMYSLKISGVKLSGTYDFETQTWTIPESAETGTITLDLSSSPVRVSDGMEEITELTGNAQTFFVIPQECTEEAKIEISYKTTEQAEPVTHEIAIPEGFEFEENYEITFNIGPRGENEYIFELVNESDKLQSFRNKDDVENRSIYIVSEKDYGIDETEWRIKSVKVGSEEIPIDSESFSDKGGLSATCSGNVLSLQASSRTAEGPGTHAYWVNEGGVSGDEDGSGWSPKSWGADGDDKGTIDLSRYDPYTDNPTGLSMTTANCYIIRHAGSYKLPLVYGNGVVNGAFNTYSYKLPVRNHLDKEIISPFIEYNKIDADSFLIPAGADIVWQDDAKLLTIDGITQEEVSVVDESGTSGTFNISYINFSVPQDIICQNNALIAVKDSDGKIMWSWHIWTTNDPALLSDPISVKNKLSNEFMFFPMYCLGWIDAVNYPGRDEVKIVLEQDVSGKELEIIVEQPDVVGQSNGCYYQCGRKDPMCRVDTPADGEFKKEGVKVSLGTSVCNPNVLYYRASGYAGWSVEHYDNLWAGRISWYGSLIKTIYDPSPVRFKLPDKNAYTGFTTSGGIQEFNRRKFNVKGDFDNGWFFYTSSEKTSTIFFPAAGERYSLDGSVKYIGQYGLYWAADQYNYENGYGLLFTDSKIWPNYDNASCVFSFSARPVLE